MLNSLLEVSENATSITRWISVGTIALLVIILLIIAIVSAKQHNPYNTQTIALGAVCVALSTVLSLIKIPMPLGGSITLASFVPLMIYSYIYGPTKGFISGVIFGVLGFVLEPWILTPMTFVLDYILAFGMIGIIGFFGLRFKKHKLNMTLGAAAVCFARFIMHLISGVIYFNQGAVWTEVIPTQYGAFVYSALYNGAYILPDCLIAVAVIFTLSCIPSIIKLMTRLKNKYRQPEVVSATILEEQPLTVEK